MVLCCHLLGRKVMKQLSCVSHPEHSFSVQLCSIMSQHIPSHCRLPCPESVLCPRDEDMRWRQCLGLWRS